MVHNECDGSQASGPWAIGSGYRFTTRTRSAWARRTSRSRPARPPTGAGPGGTAAGPPARHDHHGATKGKKQRGWSPAGPHELRGGGLDGRLQAPCPGHHGNGAVRASRPHGTGVHGRGHHHGTGGSVASAPATPRPDLGLAAPPTGCNAHTNGTLHGGTALDRRGGATGGRRGEFC